MDGNKTPATVLPPPVTDVHAESNEPGSVTISWVPPKADPHTGDAATSYRVYASTNGYGFDGGTNVTGKDMTTVAIGGLDPKIPYYFKVAAVNDGGESEASEVVAAVPSGGEKQVLVVNGFDRMGHTLNPKQTYQRKECRARAAAAEQFARLCRASCVGDSCGEAGYARGQHEQRSGCERRGEADRLQDGGLDSRRGIDD